MRQLLLQFLIFCFCFYCSSIHVNAETEFEMYLSDFYQKQEQASKILKEIETDLKGGSRERICSRQIEAAKYGIEATQSLIKAFKISGSTTEIQNLQAGIDKWRELRDYC